MSREEKETLLQQRAKVLWFTGLSGAGKTTLADALERSLAANGIATIRLDGDALRTGLCEGLGFSDEARTENIRRAAEAARLCIGAGVVVLATFITPSRAMRDLARARIGEADFLEIYVNAPLAVCEARDVKGLYRKARAGGIAQFTGLSAAYEPPNSPWQEIHTDIASIESATRALTEAVMPLLVRP